MSKALKIKYTGSDSENKLCRWKSADKLTWFDNITRMTRRSATAEIARDT